MRVDVLQLGGEGKLAALDLPGNVVEGPQSMEPNDWLNWGKGIATPEPGCITVFSFKGLGHVGFFISQEGNNLNILGGNQSDVVKISRYAKKDAIGYRLPVSSAPSPSR